MTHPGSDHTPNPSCGRAPVPKPPPTARPHPQAWTELVSLRVRPCPRLPDPDPLSPEASAPQVTLGLFGLRGAQAERGPRAFAALAECCAPFEPGQRYQEFVRALRPDAPPPLPPAFSFQEFTHGWVPRSGVR